MSWLTKLAGKREHQPVSAESGLFLDYERVNRFSQFSDQYRSNQPFPHIVIDDFLPTEKFRMLMDHYPCDQDSEAWNDATRVSKETGDYVQKDKRNIRDILRMPWPYRNLIWELNSAPFLKSLSALTGIENLMPDPLLRGAGIHQIGTGGFLKIHADFTHHREFDLDRRLNFLLYLNEGWEEAYGGHLELWDAELKGPPKRVLPIANRCAIFSTTANSFHGHPHPLACPAGVYRKSIAIYYYTNGRPAEEAKRVVSTDWKEV
jgi:hypothetical protein